MEQLTREDVEARVAEARKAERRVDLSHTDLEDVDLSGLDLQGADFFGSNLRSVDFSGSDLRGANLQSAVIFGAFYDGADLRGVQVPPCSPVLSMTGLPVGSVVCWPEKDGWRVRFGLVAGRVTSRGVVMDIANSNGPCVKEVEALCVAHVETWGRVR